MNFRFFFLNRVFHFSPWDIQRRTFSGFPENLFFSMSQTHFSKASLTIQPTQEFRNFRVKKIIEPYIFGGPGSKGLGTLGRLRRAGSLREAEGRPVRGGVSRHFEAQHVRSITVLCVLLCAAHAKHKCFHAYVDVKYLILDVLCSISVSCCYRCCTRR